MSAFIYVEGGGMGAGSKESKIRCREGFHKLLEKCDFQNRNPRLVACGSRGAVYDRFVTAYKTQLGDFIAMWIDSEEPMTDVEAAWKHLENVKSVHQWNKPTGAKDDQVLLMNSCMETWIVADRQALKEYFGSELQESGLPSLVNLEQRTRSEIQEKLDHATRHCANPYAKGKRSFTLLARLNPATLAKHLPSFLRVHRILNEKL